MQCSPSLQLQLVSTDPRIWVLDDCVSPNFLNAVDAAFDGSDSGRVVIEKRNGEKIEARGIDMEVDELGRELFQTISKVCGLDAAMPGHRQFMVSEVFCSSQDAHIDSANLDDVAAGQPIEFLDLSRQSVLGSNPYRVVPTITAVLYFNEVGGIRFPHADGADVIASKRGRMVLFENYDDDGRPSHKQSATHYGICFETLPKRMLVMGILANSNPPMNSEAEPTKGLIYCAGTKREPLGFGGGWYRPPEPPRFWRDPEPKQDLIIQLERTTAVGSEIIVVGRSLGGSELCRLQCSQAETVLVLRGEIKRKVDPEDKHNVVLSRSNGGLLTAEHDNQLLARCLPAAPSTTTETEGKSLCLCAVS